MARVIHCCIGWFHHPAGSGLFKSSISEI